MRITNDYEKFIDRCRKLIKDLIQLEYEQHRIWITIWKFVERNRKSLLKYELTNDKDLLRFVKRLNPTD